MKAIKQKEVPVDKESGVDSETVTIDIEGDLEKIMDSEALLLLQQWSSGSSGSSGSRGSREVMVVARVVVVIGSTR